MVSPWPLRTLVGSFGSGTCILMSVASTRPRRGSTATTFPRTPMRASARLALRVSGPPSSGSLGSGCLVAAPPAYSAAKVISRICSLVSSTIFPSFE